MKPFDPLVLRAKVAVFIELWQKTVEIRRRDALLAEQELAAVERESEVRYRSLADAVPQIVWTADADGVITYRNERWYELTGLRTATERSPGRTSSTRTMRPRPAKPGTKRAVLERRSRSSTGSAAPTARIAGSSAARCRRRHDGWVGTATDIEDRKLAEERQAFLAEAGWVLGSSLDYEQTLADVARLAVPRVADWCAVDIFVDGELAAARARARRPAQARARPRAGGADALGGRGRDAHDRAACS